jgi:uncharacterized coiled-coil protein SlyX
MSDFISTPPMVKYVTLEELSSTLAEQTNDQDRYDLAEKIIVEQVTHRDHLLAEQEKLLAEQERLLAEQQTMIDKIRDLEERLAESCSDPAPIKNLETSKFILQIPAITENYKDHMDFGKVAVLSDLDATEYHGSKILKPNEKAELTDKIVRTSDKYPIRTFADMKKTMNSLHQQFLTNSLFACAHILSSEDEGMELYATWNKGWAKMSENDKDAKNAKLQSSTILEEILRRIFSKDNPALALQIQHARTKVPEDLLGVYALHIVREHFPQATLDVIVRDIIRVLMFSLQAPRCTTFAEWHRKLQKSIEDLNLLYGAISWDQIYLAIVVWALELMDNKYVQLRQHMKFNLPGTTKALLENPIDTLDQIIRMVTKWDSTQVTLRLKNAMGRRRNMDRRADTLYIVAELLDIPVAHQGTVNAVTYNATTETDCSYCKQGNHTLEMCRNRKFDREVKDKVAIIVPSLVKSYKALHDLLQQKGRVSNDLEKMIRSTLKTFQGLTIGGIKMRDRIPQTPKIANGHTPKQGEKQPFNKTLQHTPKVNNGGQNGKIPGKEKQKDKTRRLSRSLLMTRKARPEQIWYLTKNMCKQRKDMLDFT